MARKFTAGRQNEIALSKELHDLLMALKYINNGVNVPIQDKQSPIPSGAIWNDKSRGQNIIKINESNGNWVPAFEGYYHPASLLENPLNPVNGQLRINAEKDNLMEFYDHNTGAWIAAKAVQTTSTNVLVDMHNNFMNMTSLKDIDSISGQETYLVPYEYHGKLFDNGVYIHPSDSKYTPVSEIGVQYSTTNSTDQESWIHVNANKLFNIEKKLIKVNKTGSTAYKIYGLFDNNTELYVLDSNGYGKAIKPYIDYKPFDKGIELISSVAKAADFIYSISYVFYDTARPGKLIRKDFTIGSQAQVQVGQLTKRPMIFLDGLYLEQSKYNYNSKTGNVEINDEIINPMDMMAIVFKDIETSGEKTINNITGPGEDTKVGTFTNAQNFRTPLAFVSGVMGTNIFTPEEIYFEGTSLVIKNFGPDVVDPVKVMVVEADNMYLGHGTINSNNIISNEGITSNIADEYILFVDGVLVSSRDLDVSEKQIRLANAIEGQQYVLLKIQDESSTALSFDAKVMNFTLSIKNDDGTLYNECDNATIFADGKLIAMNDSLYKTEIPLRGTSGQIIKVKISAIDDYTSTEDAIYKYLCWNDNIAEWEEISSDLIAKVESFIKGDFSNGSIMLDSTGLENKKGTYYAYTFANSVEEPLLKGKRQLIENQTEYSVNVKHNFNIEQGALSVYVNKLLSHDVKEESSNTGKFIVPILEADEGINPYDNSEALYYIERPEKKEIVSCEREVLTALNRNEEYQGGYNTNISLLPGIVHVYVNGIRLERNDFTIVNEKTLIIHPQIVGGQRTFDAINESTWNKYTVYTKNEEVEINCPREDYIIVEVRQDYNIKTQSINTRYEGQRTFYLEDDGIPKSLLLTQDLIKIYIDGVIYDGEYIINKENGSITLLDTQLESIIHIDPIARYFELNPDKHDEYIREYGSAYIAKPQKNRITFEWR